MKWSSQQFWMNCCDDELDCLLVIGLKRIMQLQLGKEWQRRCSVDLLRFIPFFNRMSLLQWQKALVHLLLKSCHTIESNTLELTRTQIWMLSRTSRALWWCRGLCVRLGIMSNFLENNVALSEVGSKNYALATKDVWLGSKKCLAWVGLLGLKEWITCDRFACWKEWLVAMDLLAWKNVPAKMGLPCALVITTATTVII